MRLSPESETEMKEDRDYLLEVRNLNTYYIEGESIFASKKRKKQVCKDISFGIKRGEILGLLGESGSGKTTLVKAILGITKEYTGEICLHCKQPQMIFQDPYGSLNPSKKVLWILEEPLRVEKKYSKEEMKKKAFEMLARVGLDEKIADRYPDELSGGQRQRVCIAMALMLEPELLIADEPVSALDVTIQAQIIRLLLQLQRDMNLAILFISHDLRVIYQMCERVMIMQEGRIVEEGELISLFEHPKDPYTIQLMEAAGIR